MAKDISNKVIIEGEAKIFPEKGTNGFRLVNDKNEELNFEEIARDLYYSGKNYSYNTKIKYKIIINRVNK